MLPAIFIFLAASGLGAWIIFLGGAEDLEGSFLSGFLVYYRARMVCRSHSRLRYLVLARVACVVHPAVFFASGSL